MARAAAIARAHGIPVTVDVDTIYPGFDRVLPLVDYLVASSEFPAAWTGERDPFEALETLQNEYGMKVAAMTLGAHGALARDGGRFFYAPALRGGLRWIPPAPETCFTGRSAMLFSKACRCATLSIFPTPWPPSTAPRLGARGGIRGLDEIRALMARAGKTLASGFRRPRGGSTPKCCFPSRSLSRVTRGRWSRSR